MSTPLTPWVFVSKQTSLVSDAVSTKRPGLFLVGESPITGPRSLPPTRTTVPTKDWDTRVRETKTPEEGGIFHKF